MKQENSNLPQTKHYETLFSPFLVAVTSITIVTVKPHPTMAKGEGGLRHGPLSSLGKLKTLQCKTIILRVVHEFSTFFYG